MDCEMGFIFHPWDGFVVCFVQVFFFSFQGNGGGYMSFLYTPVTYMINGIQMDLYHISKL